MAKKIVEKKEETKAPSAEVSENGAEVETAKDESGVEYIECPKKQKTMLDLAGELKLNIEELKGFDIDHHNKGVINIAVESALKAIDEVVRHLTFAEKALNEKRTNKN